MIIAKNIYNTKTLLGMLDLAIDSLIENDACSCCKIFPYKDERCGKIDLCKNFIFEGLLNIYRRTKKDKKTNFPY